VIKLLYLEILYGAAGARDVFEDLCYELIQSQFPDIEVFCSSHFHAHIHKVTRIV